MDLSQYVTQLREDLASAAAAGDEQARRTAALLGAAIEPAARLAIMNALSDLAAEVTAALHDRIVEVRLDGRDVRVAVSADHDGADQDRDRRPGPDADHSDAMSDIGPAVRGFAAAEAGDISRITLRLVEQIKSQAEQAAATQGMSLNSWVAQAVQGALSGTGRRHGRRDGWPDGGKADRDGRRIRGWVQG